MQNSPFTNGLAGTDILRGASNYSIKGIHISNVVDGRHTSFSGNAFHGSPGPFGPGFPFCDSSGNAADSTSGDDNDLCDENQRPFSSTRAREWRSYAQERIRFAENLEKQAREARKQAESALKDVVELEQVEARAKNSWEGVKGRSPGMPDHPFRRFGAREKRESTRPSQCGPYSHLNHITIRNTESEASVFYHTANWDEVIRVHPDSTNVPPGPRATGARGRRATVPDAVQGVGSPAFQPSVKQGFGSSSGSFDPTAMRESRSGDVSSDEE